MGWVWPSSLFWAKIHLCFLYAYCWPLRMNLSINRRPNSIGNLLSTNSAEKVSMIFCGKHFHDFLRKLFHYFSWKNVLWLFVEKCSLIFLEIYSMIFRGILYEFFCRLFYDFFGKMNCIEFYGKHIFSGICHPRVDEFTLD